MRAGLRHAGLYIAALAVCLTTTLPACAKPSRVSAKVSPAEPLAEPLYAAAGIRPQDVLQGELGSCSIDAVLAAMAAEQPGMIRRAIQLNADGTYTVHFLNGDSQVIFPQDIRYALRHGYDRSHVLWVGVLLRAYAQQVEAQALIAALRRADLPWFARSQMESLVRSSPLLLEAYDRAIRAAVNQSGSVNAARLKWHWAAEAKADAIPSLVADAVTRLLNTAGFWQVLSRSVRRHPEAYGAYRAVDDGSELTSAMAIFVGNTTYIPLSQTGDLQGLLAQAQAHHWVVAAGTTRQLPPTESFRFGSWWVGGHAYSVLHYDAAGQLISVRNPWGQHPEPDGVQVLPLSDFQTAFLQVVIGKPHAR